MVGIVRIVDREDAFQSLGLLYVAHQDIAVVVIPYGIGLLVERVLVHGYQALVGQQLHGLCIYGRHVAADHQR